MVRLDRLSNFTTPILPATWLWAWPGGFWVMVPSRPMVTAPLAVLIVIGEPDGSSTGLPLWVVNWPWASSMKRPSRVYSVPLEVCTWKKPLPLMATSSGPLVCCRLPCVKSRATAPSRVYWMVACAPIALGGVTGSSELVRDSTLKPLVSALAMLLATMSSSRCRTICRDKLTYIVLSMGAPSALRITGRVLQGPGQPERSIKSVKRMVNSAPGGQLGPAKPAGLREG